MTTTTAPTIVRKSNVAGPCIPLGELVKETAKFYVYTDRHGKQARIARDQYGLNHIEPCSCCRDHKATQYPHGYMD